MLLGKAVLRPSRELWGVTNAATCCFPLPEFLENVTLVHKPVSLQPRGLINKGNWCYINAVSLTLSPAQLARVAVWVAPLGAASPRPEPVP